MVCTGANERVFVHARYDCKSFAFVAGLYERHCDKCWCAVCGKEAVKCPRWAEHCSTSRQAVAAALESDRAATLLKRIEDAPVPIAQPGPLQVCVRARSATQRRAAVRSGAQRCMAVRSGA